MFVQKQIQATLVESAQTKRLDFDPGAESRSYIPITQRSNNTKKLLSAHKNDRHLSFRV